MFTAGCAVDVGVWFGSALVINELSTPFLNIFWYLGHIGKKGSLAFKVNGLLLALVFFLSRIVYIPINAFQFYMLGVCLNSKNASYKWGGYLMCLGYLAIYALNAYWFLKLMRGALKSLIGS